MRKQGYRKLHSQSLVADTAKAKTARKKWLRNIVTTLACLVVFVTTYLLILPAVTMDENNAALCGLVDHTHTAECYAEDGSVICSLPEHEHDMGCFTARSPLPSNLCGFTYEHSHTDACYSEGVLVCTLTEHRHSIYTGCYNLNCFDHVIYGKASDGTVVSVSGNLPEDAYITVSPVDYTYDQVSAMCGEGFGGSFAAYDVSLMVKDEEYTPEEGVTVNFLKPASIVDTKSNETLGVKHILEDSGSCLEMLCQVEDEKVSFKTDSFSPFILYSVNFIGNDKVYTLQSNEAPKSIAEILTTLGYGTYSDSDIANAVLDTTGYSGALLDEITNCLIVSNDAGVWKVQAANPFYTRENIIVTLSGGSVINLAASGTTVKVDKPELKRETVNSVEVSPAAGVEGSKTGALSNSLLRMDYSSDHSTSDIQKRDFYVETTVSSSQNNGKTSTDKTVIYGDNEYYKDFSYEDGDFSVTLSALGQQYENGESHSEEVPVDVVFILDVSGSMNSGTPVRRTLLTNALNDLIDGVMALNDGNRVGVVTFGASTSYTTKDTSSAWTNDVQELLPLGRYYVGANNATPNYDLSAGNSYITDGTRNVTIGSTNHTGVGYLQTASNLRTYDYTDYHYTNGGQGGWTTSSSSTSVAQRSVNVIGATFTQGGIQLGGEMLYNNTDTVWQSPVSQRKYTRTPVFILISDGAPTLLSEDYKNPIGRNSTTGATIAGLGRDSEDVEFLGAAGYYTILSANYWKRQVTSHYGKQASFYTIGMGINATGYDNAVSSSVSGDHYKRAVLNPSAENIADLVSATSRGQTGHYRCFSGVMHALLNNQTSAVGLTESFVSGGKITVGENTITGGSSVSRIDNPYLGDYSYADASYNDATWASEGGQIDKLAATITEMIEANIKTYSYTSAVRTTASSAIKLADTIGDGMEIKTEAGIILRYDGVNYQLTETSAGSGVFRYMGDATVTPNHFASEIPLAGDTDIGSIEVTVTTDISGAQSVTWGIPSIFMPEYTHTSSGDWYYDELPIRLMYKVGLTDSAKAEIAAMEPGQTLTYYANNPDEYNAQSTLWPCVTTGRENPYYAVAHDTSVSKTTVAGSSVAANPTGTVTTSYRSQNAAGDSVVYSYMGNNGKLVFTRTDAPTPTSDDTVDYVVNKVWKNPQGTTITSVPGVNSVTIQLIKTLPSTGKSTVYDTKTVTAAAGWTYTWKDLPKTQGGETLVWSAKEVEINNSSDNLSFYKISEGAITESTAYWKRVTSFTAGKTYYFVTASGTQRALSYSGTGSTLTAATVSGMNTGDNLTVKVPESQQWIASASGNSAVLRPASNANIAMRLKYTQTSSYSGTYSFAVDGTTDYNSLTINNANATTKQAYLRFTRGSNNRYLNNAASPTPQTSGTYYYIYELNGFNGFTQTITNTMRTTRTITVKKTLKDSCEDMFTMDIGYFFEGSYYSLGYIDLGNNDTYTVQIPEGACFKIREVNPGDYKPNFIATGTAGTETDGVYTTEPIGGDATVEVHNETSAVLPFTGGSGAQWYIICGAAIMALAVAGFAVIYIKRKKKQ